MILAGHSASFCVSTKHEFKGEPQIPLEDYLTFKINLGNSTMSLSPERRSI